MEPQLIVTYVEPTARETALQYVLLIGILAVGLVCWSAFIWWLCM